MCNKNPHLSSSNWYGLNKNATYLSFCVALSPIDLYPKLLQFEPCISESLNMSTFRPCIRPLVITRGSDQLAVSTKYEDRNSIGVVRNYGSMLVDLCSAIPDGVVAFFTSYSYMEQLVAEWDAMGVLRELTRAKLVFIETKDVVETTLALDNYRRACDSGRGAVFLSVARGKVRITFMFRVFYVPGTSSLRLIYPDDSSSLFSDYPLSL